MLLVAHDRLVIYRGKGNGSEELKIIYIFEVYEHVLVYTFFVFCTAKVQEDVSISETKG